MIGADECKHPLHFLNQRIPVPPVCIRPSVVSELKSGSNEVILIFSKFFKII